MRSSARQTVLDLWTVESMPSTPAISDGTPKIVLRKLILDHHHGELFVGTAEVVETDHAGIPYLIAAPTMRVPMILGHTHCRRGNQVGDARVICFDDLRCANEEFSMMVIQNQFSQNDLGRAIRNSWSRGHRFHRP